MTEGFISREADQALCKLLYKLKLIPEEKIKVPFQSSEFSPIAYFAKQGNFKEEDTLPIIAKKLHVKLCHFDKPTSLKIASIIDHNVLSNLSIQRWRDLRAIPVEINDKQLTIAFANPLDTDAQQTLEFEIGREIKVALAKEDEILSLLAKKASSTRMFDLEEMFENTKEAPKEENSPELSRSQEHATEGDLEAPPVVRLVNKIFSDAIQVCASDVHLQPQKDQVPVRVRIDGIMQELFHFPKSLQEQVISRVKLLCGMDIAEKRKPQDGRLRVKTNFGIKDLRISTVSSLYGENVVIRLLSSDLTHLSFASLGMNEITQTLFTRALGGPSRVILATGPTGSGKTSTLYASLLYLRDGTHNIITIEDPIEQRIQGITQIQVNPKINLGFADGLRSVLRQDPDIIMVGEIRDYETASIAMQAAQTGHLVFSTLHTNSAAAAITRLRDLGIASYVLASSLGAIVAQRLVRKLCAHCSVPLKGIDLTPYLAFGLKPECSRVALGCDECQGSGFKGRVGVYSFLEVDNSVREAIREELSEEEIEVRASEAGFLSLTETGVQLLNSGLTSLDELERSLGPLDALSREIPAAYRSKHMRFQDNKSSSSLRKRKILLVEDDANIRTILSILFANEMFEVVEAENGFDALEKLYETSPDIIVCDLMMPRMGGLDFIKRLRHDPHTKSIPVLMLTAADTEANEIQSIHSGADDFVSKTSDSKLMLARIYRLLERVG